MIFYATGQGVDLSPLIRGAGGIGVTANFTLGDATNPGPPVPIPALPGTPPGVTVFRVAAQPSGTVMPLLLGIQAAFIGGATAGDVTVTANSAAPGSPPAGGTPIANVNPVPGKPVDWLCSVTTAMAGAIHYEPLYLYFP